MAELEELTGGLEVFLLLLLGEGAELPLALVDVTLHDDTLGARDDAVVAGGYFLRRLMKSFSIFCTQRISPAASFAASSLCFWSAVVAS